MKDQSMRNNFGSFSEERICFLQPKAKKKNSPTFLPRENIPLLTKVLKSLKAHHLKMDITRLIIRLIMPDKCVRFEVNLVVMRILKGTKFFRS